MIDFKRRVGAFYYLRLSSILGIFMRIFVQVKAGAKNEKFAQHDAFHFMVSVCEPPVEGKANYAVAKIIAEYFKVSPSQVALVSGFTSKNKVFEIA